MVNDGDQTVADDCRVYLDTNGVFGVSPEFLDLQMLLYPFEEQLHEPTVLVKERYF